MTAVALVAFLSIVSLAAFRVAPINRRSHIGISTQGIVLLPRALDGSCILFAGSTINFRGTRNTIDYRYNIFWLS